jgi:putative transcription antitermination factor YqgF
MKWLGIDFGLKHIGLSIAEGPLAAPLMEVKFQSSELLVEEIKKEEPDVVVLGLPEGNLAKKIKELGSLISKNLKTPVYFQDETLSTHEAKLKLLAGGARQKKRRQDHVAAATIILQEYLDDHYQD